MRSETYYTLRNIKACWESGKVSAIEAAYAMLAGMSGEFIVEKHDTVCGLMGCHRISITKMAKID
ncbi:MAG: hypothetical protein P4L67_04520 [Candidatus Pacebacteria bacterium]|nr:hypothetical protein [Candidatus Paceibacterota bacterium]